MSHQWLIGVDLGGTTIKMAVLDSYGTIIKKWMIPTDCSEKGRKITTHIAQSLDNMLENLGQTKQKVTGIGMGAPGFIEINTGVIYEAVNIGWKNFPLKDRLEVETELPVFVDNDANLAALGEMWRGAGDGAKNLICVTLGTGVGGGIVANGEILHGVCGMAGEIGHITSEPINGAPCNCGKKGCLETIASATGISRIAMDEVKKQQSGFLYELYMKNEELTAKDVFEGVTMGDPLAKKVIDHVCFHLGLALANVGNILNPEKIVIGGGVSKAGDLLLEPLTHYFKMFALSRVAKNTDFAIATLGNDAGVIGGGWLVKQKLNGL